MKQTAVEWLVEQLKENNMLTFDEWTELVEQAKAMEKEQIIEAYCNGDDNISAQQYYKETYESKILFFCKVCHILIS